MRIPRVTPIEVPKIDSVPGHLNCLKAFHLPPYYYQHLTLPTNSLEQILGYELMEEDLPILESLLTNKKIPAGLMTPELFERIIETWEHDTGKGQIIPDVRATYLIKELKVCERLDAPENYLASTLILKTLYDHWAKMRDKMGHPMLRTYWKTEGGTDSQLKIAFQSRGSGYRERMRLRNSKKNDTETFDKVIPRQMKNLLKQMESLRTILQAIHCRETLKKSTVESKIAYFECERAEKINKKIEIFLPDTKAIEVSKELRSSTKVNESQIAPVPEPVNVPIQVTIKPELPTKRPRGEVQKKAEPNFENFNRKNYPSAEKSSMNFEIALICCRLISEGEKLKLWPLIDPKRGETNEITTMPSQRIQLQNEDKLKMRGRIIRGNKKIAIDRLMINDCEHSWGRYMGLNGAWHSLESELHAEYYDDEDNEAFQRLHKLLTTGYRGSSKIRSH